jgi:hypothetical protein
MTKFIPISNKTASPLPRRRTILLEVKIRIWYLDGGRTSYSSPSPDERRYLTTCQAASFSTAILSPAQLFNITQHLIKHGQSQWTRELRHVSAAAGVLGLWGSNPADAMDVSIVNVCLAGTDFCDGPNSLPEEPYSMCH